MSGGEDNGSDHAALTPPQSLPAADALSLLRSSHRRLLAMFDDCARLAVGDAIPGDRAALVGRLSLQMRAHATVTNEILVPVLQGNPAAEAAAAVSRDASTALLATLESLAVVDVHADATSADGSWTDRVTALGAKLCSFVQHEEAVLLPAAATQDLASIGDRVASRYAELTADHGSD